MLICGEKLSQSSGTQSEAAELRADEIDNSVDKGEQGLLQGLWSVGQWYRQQLKQHHIGKEEPSEGYHSYHM